jgi:hypothetical protein
MIIFQDETYNLIEFVDFKNIHIYSERVNTSNLTYWGTCQYFNFKTCCKKILQKIFSMKNQNVQKGPICG